MDIFGYADRFGKYTFEEISFNEVDNVIFSTLAYVNYDTILTKTNAMRLEDVSNEYFLNNKSNFFDIMAIRHAVKLLKKVSKTNRYKNIIMNNYEYIGTESSQFSAITFHINDKLCYVAFEGTDQLITGWKEDCKMAYQFPVEAHKYAIKYLNENYTFFNKKIIVGGHSKGGNLALVSSMNANIFVRMKIKKIYNNDGQGLRESELCSNKYKRIKKKYIHIIPNYSVVGLLLRHYKDYKVIKSNKRGLTSHCTSYWMISDDHFINDELSNFSKMVEQGVEKWLDKYNYEQIEQFIDSVFKILEENNVTSLIQLKKEIKLIFKILKSTKNVDPIVSEMLKDLIDILIDIIGENIFE